ncbi:MAG: hypothetical protein IKV90_00545 [Clostridia bacterium]|nr:hypothetical protein [Clostridia bacterium]
MNNVKRTRMTPAYLLCIMLCCAALSMLAACAMADTVELVCIVADGQYVNVRNRASSQAAAWGIMHTGETIETNPAEITNGYFRTTFKDKAAYISVRYFEIPVEEHYTVEANGRVRVRKTPGGSTDGFVQPGDRVYVSAWRYDESGVKWGRCTGGQYISAEYLRPAE